MAGGGSESRWEEGRLQARDIGPTCRGGSGSLLPSGTHSLPRLGAGSMGPRPRAGNPVGAPRVRHDTQMEGRQEDLEGREVPSDLADREAMGNPPSPVVVASVAPYVHAAWEAGSPWNGHQAQGPSSWSCHRSSSCSCAFASRGHSGSAGLGVQFKQEAQGTIRKNILPVVSGFQISSESKLT